MNRLIIINCFLLLCLFFNCRSTTTSESQGDNAIVLDTNTISELQSDIITILDTNTLEISKEDHLIENLKELFIIEDKKNRDPLKHELLRKLIANNKLKDISAIISISYYDMRDKSNENARWPDLEFQIWKFDNSENARLYFDVIKPLVNTDAYYEKPAKHFFLVSDELYYFAAYTWNRIKYSALAINKLINCCFSKNEYEVLLSHDWLSE